MEGGKIGKKRAKRSVPTSVLVNLSNTRYSIVGTCCEELGYKVTDSNTKNLLFWCDIGGNFEFMASLYPWQFYNHFPGTWALARKTDLARNIERMSRLLPEVYTFHPKSFVVPCQTSELQTYLNSISRRSRRTFIVKPDRGSLGRGIILIRDADSIDDWSELAIAQQYISPYLIDGLKFDVRIYALVSSVQPLRIYLHSEGMARFCTQPYVKPAASNLELSFAHLTNYSLNKNSPNFQENLDAERADHGHKRSMSSVFAVLAAQGVDVEGLRAKIEDIVRLTVISVQPLLATNYRTAIPWHDGKSRCFEVLGFDILIDKRANPWLLEVNWAPSLATGSPFDVLIKKSVVTGTLKIVNIHPNFKKIIVNRRKIVSQQREVPAAAFDVDEELEIAKTTQYRLIYPLPNDHPSYEKSELALAESQMSTVGAAVNPTRVKARREAFAAQLRAKDQPPSSSSPPPVRPVPSLAPPVRAPRPAPATSSDHADDAESPRQAKARCAAKGVLFPVATRVIAPVPRARPPKPSAGGHPLIVQRLVGPIPSRETASVFEQFTGVPIDQAEEKERIRALRKQGCNAHLIYLPEKIIRCLDRSGLKRPAPIKNQLQKTPFLKTVAVYQACEFVQ